MLAVGPGAELSHIAACVLWELVAPRAGPVDVTLPDRNARSRPGIRIHRVRHLDPADITRRHNLPVTSPARTLLDLATRLTSRDLARAIEEAEIQRRVTSHSLNEQFTRYPNHRGTAALSRATTTHADFTRSEAERRLLELIRGHASQRRRPTCASRATRSTSCGAPSA